MNPGMNVHEIAIAIPAWIEAFSGADIRRSWNVRAQLIVGFRPGIIGGRIDDHCPAKEAGTIRAVYGKETIVRGDEHRDHADMVEWFAGFDH